MLIGAYLPVSFPRSVPPAADIASYAVEAERLGYDSLWTGDHLLWRQPMAEPITTLGFVAAVTERVRIGINVYLAALRPSIVSARQLGNLWWLSGGRLVLGVGVGGEYPHEFEAAGVPMTERGKRLDAALDDLSRWWYTSEGGTVAPCPEPRELPLWIGGRSDPALDRVVRRGADGFTAHLVTAEQLLRVKNRLTERCAEQGRGCPEIAVTVMLHVHERGEEPDAEPFLRSHFGEGFDKISRFVISGDRDHCAERLDAFRGVADHLIVLPASYDALEQLRRFRDVVPTSAPEGGR